MFWLLKLNNLIFFIAPRDYSIQFNFMLISPLILEKTGSWQEDGQKWSYIDCFFFLRYETLETTLYNFKIWHYWNFVRTCAKNYVPDALLIIKCNIIEEKLTSKNICERNYAINLLNYKRLVYKKEPIDSLWEQIGTIILIWSILIFFLWEQILYVREKIFPLTWRMLFV